MNKSLLDFIKYLSREDKKTLSQKALKLCEEVGELAKVVLPYDNADSTTHRFIEKERILEEVVDSILVAYSVAISLDFDDFEIEEKVKEKVAKWSSLQSRDRRIKYPLPYEIHITIDTVSDIEKFKFDCETIGVKPILLDLHLKNNGIIKDLMTSSIFYGNNKGAYEETKRISSQLIERGYSILREKIETVPWHPAAPTLEFNNNEMPNNCYFECHLNILCNDDKRKSLEEITKYFGFVHLSRNVFKRFDDGNYVIMATVRSYTKTYEDFKNDILLLKNELCNNDFEIQKEIIEFSIYDTKINHDSSWINK